MSAIGHLVIIRCLITIDIMTTPSKKRSRNPLTAVQKRDIVLYHQKHKCKQDDIAHHFSAVWKMEIKRRTVGDILANPDKWMQVGETEPAYKRQKIAKHGDLEEILWLWFCEQRANNVIITDAILTTKAKKLGEEMSITGFCYSAGWLQRFKKRHGIGMHVLSGESAGVDAQLITDGKQAAREVISKYEPRDVFNMDETGLFFKMTPDRSLTTADDTKGVKRQKDRITVALCCNLDGSEKMRPFVIGKTLKPRCFKHFRPELYVDYTANKKAWMNGELFEEWIKKLDRKMGFQGRQILLLLDNAPSHILPSLKNVQVHFLPPTTTSHLQPLDADHLRLQAPLSSASAAVHRGQDRLQGIAGSSPQ